MSGPASEKAKVAEAERLLAEQLQEWETKMKRADEAKQAYNAAIGIPKSYNPFEGAPLSPLFPKTPMNFRKGEPVVAVKSDDKVKEEMHKPSINPFEGVPLSPDFPKTPLQFHRGRVVGEGLEQEEMPEEKQGKDDERDAREEGKQEDDVKDDDRWHD